MRRSTWNLDTGGCGVRGTRADTVAKARGCGDSFSPAVGQEDPQQLASWGAMDGLKRWMGRKKFQFEAITSLSMLEPAEKRVLCILP